MINIRGNNPKMSNNFLWWSGFDEETTGFVWRIFRAFQRYMTRNVPRGGRVAARWPTD